MDFTEKGVFKTHWRVLTGTEYLVAPLGYHYISNEAELEKLVKILLRTHSKEEIRIRKIIEIDYVIS